MKKRGRFTTVLKCFTAAVTVCAAIGCVCIRLPQCFSSTDRAVLTAAAFTLSDGKIQGGTEKNTEAGTNAQEETAASSAAETAPVDEEEETVSRNWDDYYNSYGDHEGEEKYTVTERQYTEGGTQYENFYVKNKTDYALDIGEMLRAPLGFEMDKKPEKIQVLIMHTHTCESYLDADVGYFFDSFYPRSTDNNFNVTQVGEAITQELKKAGIGVIHDTTTHDYPSYNGSYDRSLETIQSYLEKYPDIKVVLDIHRDAIGTETNKIKPTFTYNGKKGAQIMIMAGYDEDGSLDFPQWNYNLRFALRLQSTTETMFPGMTRPMDFGNFAYNMNVNTGSLLVEFGTDGNTLDEAIYSGKLFGQSMAKVLQS